MLWHCATGFLQQQNMLPVGSTKPCVGGFCAAQAAVESCSETARRLRARGSGVPIRGARQGRNVCHGQCNWNDSSSSWPRGEETVHLRRAMQLLMHPWDAAVLQTETAHAAASDIVTRPKLARPAAVFSLLVSIRSSSNWLSQLQGERKRRHRLETSERLSGVALSSIICWNRGILAECRIAPQQPMLQRPVQGSN